MPTRTKQPNRRLAAVMEQANVSNKGLAKRMVDLTANTKAPVRADHNDVRKWLDGMIPRAPKPRVIAEVLSRKLGRRVALAELGFEQADKDGDDALIASGVTYPASATTSVELLRRLSDGDLADRPRLVEAPWDGDVAPQIITAHMFAAPVLLTPDREEFQDGSSVAERIRTSTAHLMQMDFQYGGGHTRRMLLQFFRDQVVPELRKPHHPERERRDVFSAAAEVAQLLGWSAYDAARHGVAMRYFTQGLRLAREANDHLLGGRMLSSLSHQANFIGRYSDALNFARAAQSATVGNATNTVSTMFLAMEARALASLGDKAGTATTLHRAEKLFDARDSSSEPDWISYFDHLELAGEASHCFRDIGDSIQTRTFTELAIDPVKTPARTRAFVQMVSAAGALSGGEPEEAVSLAVESIELAAGLQSSRYIRYLTDFHKTLARGPGLQSFATQFGAALTSQYPTVSLAD